MTLEAINPSRLGTKARLAALEARVAILSNDRMAHRDAHFAAAAQSLRSWREGSLGAETAPDSIQPSSDIPIPASADPETPDGAVMAVAGEIKWGREIEVNGVRPAWLRDVDARRLGITNAIGEWQFPTKRTDCHIDGWAWAHIGKIMLPADHPAYKALDAGFEPWSGGDEAPGDWDKWAVLRRDGQILYLGACVNQSRPGTWAHVGEDCDIIGYNRAETVANKPDAAPAIDWTRPIELSDGTPAKVLSKFTHGGANARIGEDEYGFFDMFGAPMDPQPQPEYAPDFAGRTIRNVAERVAYIPDPDRPNDPPTRVVMPTREQAEKAMHTAAFGSPWGHRIRGYQPETDGAGPAPSGGSGGKEPKHVGFNAADFWTGEVADLKIRLADVEAERDFLVNDARRMREKTTADLRVINRQREEIGKLHARVPRYTEAQRQTAINALGDSRRAMMHADIGDFWAAQVDAIATALGMRKAEG